jgi:hypothetical protein
VSAFRDFVTEEVIAHRRRVREVHEPAALASIPG